MPFNGSGTYNLPEPQLVTGETVSAPEHNTTRDDMADAFTNCVTRDGQSPPVANLPMGGYKHTNVAAGVLATDYARLDQVQSQTTAYLSSVSGTNSLTAVASPAISSYVAGQVFRFKAANTNTGPMTININGVGVKNIKTGPTTALGASAVLQNAIYEIVYDGTNFQINSPLAYQTLDIKYFGAVGDGTDETALIQPVIDYAASIGGKVLVTPGTYTIHDLELTCDLVGMGGGFKLKDSATKPAIVLNADVSIDQVDFDGNKSNQNTALLTNDIAGKATIALITNITVPTDTPTYNDVSSVAIRNCKIVNSLQSAYIFKGDTDFQHITGNYFEGCVQANIYAVASEQTSTGALHNANMIISGNTFKNSGGIYSSTEWGDCITLGQYNNVTITGNNFDGNKRDSIYCGAVTNLVIDGNNFKDVSWHALQFQPSDGGVTNREFAGGLTFTNNTVNGTGLTALASSGSAVVLTGSTVDKTFIYPNVVIQGNTVVNPGSTANIAFQVLSNKYWNVTIADNTVEGYFYGAQVNIGSSDTGPDNVMICDNNLLNMTSNAIFVTGTNFVTGSKRARIFILDNYILSPDGIGIYMNANVARQLYVTGNMIHGSTGEAIYLDNPAGLDSGVIANNFSDRPIFSNIPQLRHFGNQGSSVTYSGTPLGFVRTGTANPTGSVVPAFVGETYVDTSALKQYVAAGLTNTSWFAVN